MDEGVSYAFKEAWAWASHNNNRRKRYDRISLPGDLQIKSNNKEMKCNVPSWWNGVWRHLVSPWADSGTGGKVEVPFPSYRRILSFHQLTPGFPENRFLSYLSRNGNKKKTKARNRPQSIMIWLLATINAQFCANPVFVNLLQGTHLISDWFSSENVNTCERWKRWHW